MYEDDDNLYLVMDVCHGGELFERIQAKGSYNEKDAALVIIFSLITLGVAGMFLFGFISFISAY